MTARWRALNIDTDGVDDRFGRFWAAATGLRHVPDDQGGDLVGATDGHRIGICRVPEPKVVKHRVHLDLHCASVGELEGLGAAVLVPAEESGLGWTVMADPDGGELCAFVGDDPPAYRLFQVVVDALDAERSARWWAAVLGGRTECETDPQWWGVHDVVGMPFERLLFQRVPEEKTVKNRVHWDVEGSVAALLSAGATVQQEPYGEVSWHVLADPEGNEFCVLPAQDSRCSSEPSG